MPCSSRLTTLTAAAGVSALCLGLSACGQPASTTSASSASGPPVRALAPSPLAAIGTSTDAALPASVLDLPLVDAFGGPHPLSSFAGKILVISDTMTLCQETCPIDTASVVQTARAAAQAGLSGEVEFVSITVDPQRDQGAQLKAYNALFAPTPASWTSWTSLTGPPAAIKTLWDRLGVYREKVAQENPPPKNWRTGAPLTYDIEHSDEVFFLDARQHERFVIEGPPHLSGKNALPAVLDTFMDDDGHHSLAHPDPTDWTPPQAITVIDWLWANA